MKKHKIIIMLIVLLYLLVGCSNTNTINNASLQSVLKTNPDADIFIMNNTVYMNATNIDWVTKLTLREGKVLGKINETRVKKDFQNWNATKLNTNTIIYELDDRSDIVLAEVDGNYVPYLKFVEG